MNNQPDDKDDWTALDRTDVILLVLALILGAVGVLCLIWGAQ
jgi:hypothetical protein